MQETFDYLKKLPVNYLSTISLSGGGGIIAPDCRPFGDPVLFDGKIYMLTLASKTVARELAANPHVCIVAYDEFDRRFDEEETWLRIYCEAIDDSDNRQAKQSIIDEFDWAEEAGYTLDNPDFKCYYLKNAHSEIRNADGEILASYDF